MARAIDQILSLSELDWVRLSNLAYATARRHTWHNASDLFEAALLRDQKTCLDWRINRWIMHLTSDKALAT